MAFRKCRYCREWTIGKHTCQEMRDEILLLMIETPFAPDLTPLNQAAAEIAELERLYSLSA